jgi:hypothetical protein
LDDNVMMQALFDSGHAADIVLVVLAFEAVYLIMRGNPLGQTIWALLPAALIVLGLRAALTGMHWIWIAAPVAAAFPAHLIDLKRRPLSPRS